MAPLIDLRKQVGFSAAGISYVVFICKGDALVYINDYRHEPKTELVKRIAGAVAESNGDDATMATLTSEEAYANMLSDELEKSQAELLANKAEIERLKAELAKMGRS